LPDFAWLDPPLLPPEDPSSPPEEPPDEPPELPLTDPPLDPPRSEPPPMFEFDPEPVENFIFAVSTCVPDTVLPLEPFQVADLAASVITEECWT
jgi:hypothetical protein